MTKAGHSAQAQASPRFVLISAEIMSTLGGGFRQARWCDLFLRRGFPVMILNASGIGSLAEAEVESVAELKEQRTRWVRGSSPQAGVRTGAGARLARRLKHIFLVDFLYPVNFLLFMRLRQKLASSPGQVVLLCSSPPFALALVAAIVKHFWKDRVVFALDMRDLWSLHSAFPGPKLHKRWIERWVLRRADSFTTVSVGLAKRFEEAFGVRPTVVYNVATHVEKAAALVEPLDWTSFSPTLNQESRKLVYTGSIPEGFYDLDEFTASIELFASQTPSCATQLQLVFVGASGELASRVARAAVPKDLVVFLPQATHENVAKLQAAADALLFLGYKADDNQGQVSIKLFEYFRRGRPVLPAFIKPGSDVDFLIDLYCGFCPHLNSTAALAEALSGLARDDAGSLPRATNAGADQNLLRAYDEVADRILGMLTGAERSHPVGGAARGSSTIANS